MALAPAEQFFDALKRCRSAAVVLPSEPTVDAIAAGLAIARFAESYERPAEVIAHNAAKDPALNFLPAYSRLQDTIEFPRKTVIAFPFAGELADMKQEKSGDEIKITLSPKTGLLNPTAVTIKNDSWRHDLVIMVGVRDTGEIGPLYGEHRQFFEETTTVNIDNHPANERHGHIHLLDVRASAISELVADMIEQIDAKRMDKETATSLLAGLMSATRSFRSSAVTPRTLETASKLIERGAARETVVEALFRTRPVETLRLWGRVLARLRADREHKMAWSALSRNDFIQAGADETHLEGVVEELVSRAPEAEIICIFHEHPTAAGTACALVSADRGWNALDLAHDWQPAGTHRQARIEAADTALPALEQQVLAAIRRTVATHRLA